MAAAAAAFSEGDLRQAVSPRSEFDALGRAFQDMQAIRGIIRQIMDGSRHLGESADDLTRISALMASGSEQTSRQVQSVSDNSLQINQNINSVSSATEEFAASIRNISRNLTDVSENISAAVDAAKTASDTMTTLESHSGEIGNIIQVITSVTQQTNLLALNATIEAARAGEIGRGFVVVANEVKELAKETARSTEDITHRIDTIQSSIREAKESMTQVSDVIALVHMLSSDITHAVEQQTVTTNEISENILDVAQGSDEITQSIAEVTTVASHASAHADSVQKAARELAALADELRGLVEQFKI
jgi:methyl-accepting chemotaxis protein